MFVNEEQFSTVVKFGKWSYKLTLIVYRSIGQSTTHNEANFVT